MPEGASGPAKIGGFELLATLGKGGMGVVFKARQVSMDRIVALKVLPPHLATNEAFVARFLREARSAAKLNHPNIVQGIDVGQAEGNYYFAMEFVDGTTVKEMIKSKGRLDEKSALNIVGAVARALEHAARHGIIHRDIKPDNIMVARDGAVKLADLGLARSTEKPDTMTIEGTALGTPYYMAPEQVRAQTDLDTRTDIYALGATLYHMVTGEFPFTGPNAGAIMARHLADPVPSARDKHPDVSRATDDLIQRMMAKDRDDRPANPTALLAEIRDALAGKVHLRAKAVGRQREAVGREHDVSGPRPPASGLRPPRSSKATLITAVAIAALLAIAGLVLALRPGPKPTATSVPQPPTPTTQHRPTPVPRPPTPTTQHRLTTAVRPKAKETPAPKVEPVPEPKDAAALAKWEAIKAEARKLAEAGKHDEALRAFDGAKALPLDGIADLVVESIESIEAIRSARLRAALAAYQAESDKLWALFKKRDYPEADKLLTGLVGGASVPRDLLAADQEAAKLLKEFWAAAEKGVAARKGTVSIAGALGNVTGVENGVITLQTPKEAVARRVLDLTAKQALAYAAVAQRDDERSHLAEAIFRIAESEDPALADKALAAAGNPPGLAVYKDRLDRLLGRARAVAEAKDAEALEAAAREAWLEIERVAAGEQLTRAELVVPADALWFDTGLHLSPGKKYRVAASGKWSTWPSSTSGPEGGGFKTDDTYAVSGALLGCLLGRVGDGRAFAIGKELVFTAQDDGKLLLMSNDRITVAQALIDNWGTLLVTVEGPLRADPSAPLTSRVGPVLRKVKVDARQGWTASGVETKTGERLFITAEGTWSADPSKWKSTDADGHDAAVDQRRFSALTGRIGAQGATFVIGRRYVLTAGRSGELYLVMHDTPETRADNIGSMEVSIHRFLDRLTPLVAAFQRGYANTKLYGTVRERLRALGAAEEDAKPGEWQSLFDGKTLNGWRVPEEGLAAGHGRVSPRDGSLVLEKGAGSTDIAWKGEFPTGDYELSLEAMRLDGTSRFCHIVFPLGASHAFLGVGGTDDIVLHFIDGSRAPTNETTRKVAFEQRQWYEVRLRVTAGRVTVWLDGKKLIDFAEAARRLSLGADWRHLLPLGIGTWHTTAGFRNIRFRRIEAGAAEAPKAGEWQSLFDGKTLKGWEAVRGSERRATVEDGCLVLKKARGTTTAAYCTGEFPEIDYELALDVKLVAGDNDLLKLTFPLGDSHGMLGLHKGSVALLNMDGRFPYENDTHRKMAFEPGQWYRVRLRVTKAAVQAWIDDQQVAREPTPTYRFRKAGRQPLQLETWDTTGAYRNIQVRRIDKEAGEGAEAPAPDSRAVKTKTVGGGGGGAFEDRVEGKGYMVGLKYSLVDWAGHKVVKSLQGAYETPGGRVWGKVCGQHGGGAEVHAKSGYAVGALVVRGGDRVDGFKVIFVRVEGGKLDATDRYESEWIGGTGGGEATLGGSGRLIVGLHGRCGLDVDAIGLIEGGE